MENWSSLSTEDKRAWVEQVQARDCELARFTVEEVLRYKELLEQRICRQGEIEALEERLGLVRQQLADVSALLTEARAGKLEAAEALSLHEAEMRDAAAAREAQ